MTLSIDLTKMLSSMDGTGFSPEPGGGEDKINPPEGSTSTGQDDLSKQNLELRKKITEQAEALKASRLAQEQMELRLANLEAPPANPPTPDSKPDIDKMVSDFFTEEGQTPERFKQILSAVGEQFYKKAITDISGVVGPALDQVANNTFATKVERFFEKKGHPELADRNSLFFQFVNLERQKQPYITQMLRSDVDTGLNFLYEQFKAKFQIADTPDPRDKQRLKASLFEPGRSSPQSEDLEKFLGGLPENANIGDVLTTMQGKGLLE